jgi:hypothetical protein
VVLKYRIEGFVMARPHPLKELMKTPLPLISYQKRKCYRPTLSEVNETYNLINKYVFNNKLVRPPIELGTCRTYWGMCHGLYEETRPGTHCKIKLMDKWFCLQWMVTTLAHEMVHQYEWDILEKDMTHRQSFFIWRDKLSEFGIDLKTAHRMRRWFRYQDFNKC